MPRRSAPGDEIWIADVERGTIGPFATAAAEHGMATWSKDGRRVLFAGRLAAGGPVTLFEQDAAGGLPARAIADAPTGALLSVVEHPSGDVLLFPRVGTGNQVGTWGIRRHGDPTPFQVAARSDSVRVSPDGRWLAGTGTQEVVVTDYPAGARRIVISTGGGVAGAPKRLLQLPRPNVDEGGRLDSLLLYAVSPDGRRFFAAVPLTGALPTGYVVTQNWTSRLAAP